MSKENVLLVLWIIFGFIFISGIDSILYFIINLLFFTKSELGLSYEIMNFSMPIITLILYVLTTILILKRMNLNSNSKGIYLTIFPKKLFILLALISLTLKPITHHLSTLYISHSTRIEKIGTLDIVEVYLTMTMWIVISRWLFIIILIIIFLKKLRLIEDKS